MKVIAECGSNWGGLMKNAYQMILEAKRAGCWAVKFQVFSKEQAKEWNISTNLVLTPYACSVLLRFGRRNGIEVFFTPMNLEAVDMLERIGVRFYKIRYKDNDNEPLIQKIKDTYQLAFVSLNDSSYNLHSFKFCHLYCIPAYPAKIGDYWKIHNILGYDGVSDHTGSVDLLKKCYDKFKFWEIHVKLDGTTPIEDKWSVPFSELREVIK